MRYGNRWLPVVLLVVAGVALVVWLVVRDNSTSVHAETGSEEPAKVEPIEGSDFKRVILSERAAERLDVQTAAVKEEQVDGTARTVVPYAAILYGTQGETWIYTNPEPLVFVRQPVIVERVEGDLAILSESPPVDTQVAVVAVAELFGAETGWGGSGGH